ncbi:MAG TPA: GNAT family N-acetyltransferase [Bacilli bacterium]
MDVNKLFSESPVFETRRLQLRRLSLADINDYYELASSPIVTAQTAWDRHITYDDTRNYINKILQRYEDKDEYHWGIVYKKSNRLIGRIGLIQIDPIHEKAELGYVISDRYWNQGIVTEATYPILDYGFKVLGLNRIEARCNFNNVESYRVMEKLGLSFEGILRKQLKINGIFTDQRIYSILRDEFFSRQNSSEINRRAQI